MTTRKYPPIPHDVDRIEYCPSCEKLVFSVPAEGVCNQTLRCCCQCGAFTEDDSEDSTMSRPIRVRDLQDQTGSPSPRPILHCAECDGEYSANAGDYFAHYPATVMKCCGEPMQLVTKHVEYREITR